MTNYVRLNRTLHNARLAGILSMVLVLALSGWDARAQEPGVAGAPADEPEPQFTDEELEELVAPIALYPDVLTAQILPASTNPLDIVQAQRFLQDNAGKVDEETIKNLDYDVSVLALMHYPEVIEMLNEDLDWTAALGDAVVAQQEDVMDAIQRVRTYAMESGNLVTSEQMTVVREKEIIVIEPTSPQVVYVPRYDPQVIVIKEERRTYPAVTFGVGLAIGSWLGYACSWHSSSIKIDVKHRSYWVGVRPGWGAQPVWRPRPVPYRHGVRTAHRAGYRAGARTGARAGARTGAVTGARAGATAGARTGAAAGRQAGAVAGGRSGAYGGYESGRTAARNSNRGAASRGGHGGGGRSGGGRRR